MEAETVQPRAQGHNTMVEEAVWQELRADKNEIRLLTIDPANDSQSLISCSLFIASLDHTPQYEALSYVWGDAALPVPILLNGRPWQVRQNLDHALRNFRLAQAPRFMFVDALCIDQNNKVEKSTQVPLMSRIYRQASCVRCWLGIATPDAERAIEMLRLSKANLLVDAMISHAQTTTKRDLEAITNLLRRPYWDRVWIVQEVVLASSATFHCGQYFFHWDMVSDMRQLDNSITVGLQSILHHPWPGFLKESLCVIEELSHGVKELSHIITRRLDPLGLLKQAVHNGNYLNGTELTHRIFSCRAATLPHDHIYACLGLLEPKLREMVIADYDKDVSLVYRDFALASMKVSGTPSLIHAAIGLRHTSYELSSWVPDYSQENINLASYFYSFMANDEIESYFQVNDRGLLEIGGCYLDEIVAHCPCDTQCRRIDLADETVLEYHCRWRKFFRLPEIPSETTDASAEYVTTGTLEQAYWATLARGHCFDNTTRQKYWLDSETVDACKFWLHNLTQEPKLLIPPAVRRQVDNFHESVTAMDATHLFRTRHGFIGITHRSTPLEIGDHIFLIAGMSCPCILRPPLSPQGDLVYKFVSTGYVHGAMLRCMKEEDAPKGFPKSDYIDYTNPLASPEDSWYRVLLA